MIHQVHYIDPYNIASYNKSIAVLYRSLPALKAMDIVDRVSNISATFLGRPYMLGAVGEGHLGCFDQAPLYRFDVFDCVTYVNIVLALALSHDVVSFRKNLIRVAYHDAQLEYVHRHHFMSVDWNVHNQAIGLVNDISPEFVDKSGQSIVRFATALIDRPNWIRRRKMEDIRLLQKISSREEKKLLEKLHKLAEQMDPVQSYLPYLPLEKLFDAKGNPNQALFRQIPHGAIVEIVRPNWDLQKKIGTHLNVSHVGFAIWKRDALFYRQASSIEKCVFDISMIEYLRCRLESPTIKGINVQSLL